jgi:hypothetical protein
MYAAEIIEIGLRVFVQRFVVNVAKPKIAVSLTLVSAAVFRHPAGAMESVSPKYRRHR